MVIKSLNIFFLILSLFTLVFGIGAPPAELDEDLSNSQPLSNSPSNLDDLSDENLNQVLSEPSELEEVTKENFEKIESQNNIVEITSDSNEQLGDVTLDKKFDSKVSFWPIILILLLIILVFAGIYYKDRYFGGEN